MGTHTHLYSFLWLQYVRKQKKFFAHDEREECREGDWVIIKECRPLTKNKHFNVVEIVERAQRSPNSDTSLTSTIPHDQMTHDRTMT